jgi:hypothetical protein
VIELRGKMITACNTHGGGEIGNPKETPNVMVEWITLLFRIREAPVSNLGPATGYPD